jgi:hypothetical protein
VEPISRKLVSIYLAIALSAWVNCGGDDDGDDGDVFAILQNTKKFGKRARKTKPTTMCKVGSTNKVIDSTTTTTVTVLLSLVVMLFHLSQSVDGGDD